jgi:hypothetical protein
VESAIWDPQIKLLLTRKSPFNPLKRIIFCG